MGFARFSNRLVVATYSIRGALISEPGVSELWEENALYAGCTGFSSASLQRAGGTSGVSLRAKKRYMLYVVFIGDPTVEAVRALGDGSSHVRGGSHFNIFVLKGAGC